MFCIIENMGIKGTGLRLVTPKPNIWSTNDQSKGQKIVIFLP